MTRFVEKRLKLKVNASKSTVDRPWNRKFLGYSMTYTRQPKLKPAKGSVDKQKGNMRELCRKGRGSNLQRFIQEDLNAKLRDVDETAANGALVLALQLAHDDEAAGVAPAMQLEGEAGSSDDNRKQEG